MVCCRERPAWWGALVKVDIPFKYSAQVGRTTEWKEKRLHIWLSGRTTRQSCQSCLDSSRHFPSFVQISTPTLFTHRDFPFLFSITTLKKKRNCLKKGGSIKVRFCGRKRGSLFFYIVCLHGRGQRTYFFISPANSEASSARSVPRSFGAEVCTMWLEAYLEMSPPSFVSWSLIQK